MAPAMIHEQEWQAADLLAHDPEKAIMAFLGVMRRLENKA